MATRRVARMASKESRKSKKEWARSWLKWWIKSYWSNSTKKIPNRTQVATSTIQVQWTNKQAWSTNLMSILSIVLTIISKSTKSLNQSSNSTNSPKFKCPKCLKYRHLNSCSSPFRTKFRKHEASTSQIEYIQTCKWMVGQASTNTVRKVIKV